MAKQAATLRNSLEPSRAELANAAERKAQRKPRTTSAQSKLRKIAGYAITAPVILTAIAADLAITSIAKLRRGH